MLEQFNPYDIAVLAILVLSTFWGGMRGVITQIASIATWGGGWLIATRYHTVVLKYISASETWRTPVAVIVTFAIAAIAIGIGAAFVKRVFSLVGLKEFDRQAGAFCGLIKGAIFCLLITFFMVIVGGKGRDLVGESKCGPFFISLINSVQDHFPDSELSRKFDEVVSSMELKEEEKVEDVFQSEVDELKSYLKNRVLSGSAADLVEEADTIEESENENKSETSVFKSFASNFRRLGDEIGNAVKRVASGAKTEEEQPLNSGATFSDEYASNSVDQIDRSYSYDVNSANRNDYQYSNNSENMPLQTSGVAYGGTSGNYSQTNASASESDMNDLSSFLQNLDESSRNQRTTQNSYDRLSNRSEQTYGDYSNDVYRSSDGYQNNVAYNRTESLGDDSFDLVASSGEFGFSERPVSSSSSYSSSRTGYDSDTNSRYSRSRRSNSSSASSRRLGTHNYTISSSNY